MTDIILHCLYLQLAEMENSPLTQGFRSFHPLVRASAEERDEFYQSYSDLVELYTELKDWSDFWLN
jgi:hypothetical protein